MIPYRKDDWRAASDESRGEWLAARGYAFCRLDIRGTGSSPGIALDEYTARETQDGYDAVEWLAAQPWCNGKVGMWGISYGGFTVDPGRAPPPAAPRRDRPDDGDATTATPTTSTTSAAARRCRSCRSTRSAWSG